MPLSSKTLCAISSKWYMVFGIHSIYLIEMVININLILTCFIFISMNLLCTYKCMHEIIISGKRVHEFEEKQGRVCGRP